MVGCTPLWFFRLVHAVQRRYPNTRGVSTTASASAFHADDAGSIPVRRSIRFHARWDARWDVMTVRIVSGMRVPVCSAGAHAVAPIISWMMRTVPCRRDRREFDEPTRPVAGKVSWSVVDHAPCLS